MRPTISGHVDNDHPRHWYFERDTKLPHGTFSEEIPVDKIVFWVFAAIGVAMLLGAFA